MLADLITIDRNAEIPIFRQLTDQIIQLVRKGILRPGLQLPGSRILSEKLKIHRKTVVSALDELVAQGWLETVPGRGTFIAQELSSGFQSFDQGMHSANLVPKFQIPEVIDREFSPVIQSLHLDDGLPDPRLAPVEDLMRAYRNALMKGWRYPKYTYGDTKGQVTLREAMVDYLAKTRGIHIDARQLIITRGVTQALYLVIKGLINPGDKVALGALSWESAKINFQYHQAQLMPVAIDREGLDVDHLESICQQHEVKMVYVTPHHQYPTTVIMPAHRRIKLLQLARRYGFYIFEDDYDYDFHYSLHPIMPLSATGHDGQVLYAGSFTKAISPVFRIGYLVGTVEQISYFSKLRRMIDRQGDAILELAVAELLRTGVIQRSLRKNRKTYQQRRDFFIQVLQHNLGKYMEFQVPEGGMSVWARFSPEIDLEKLAEKAHKNDLYFYNGSTYQLSGKPVNATRLGYASSNCEELTSAISLLKKLIES